MPIDRKTARVERKRAAQMNEQPFLTKLLREYQLRSTEPLRHAD